MSTEILKELEAKVRAILPSEERRKKAHTHCSNAFKISLAIHAIQHVSLMQ